ncbi:hypothetical protein, partial [Sphingobacterium lactis]|uniref:hypothetical protein n=1 Tax=Sphingobacterium lactis TaxID=797291 RepID=UPI003DA54A59
NGCFLLVRSTNSNSLSIVSIHFVFVYSFFRIGQSAQQELKNLSNDYTYVFKYFSQKMLYWGKKKEVAFGNLHPKK